MSRKLTKRRLTAFLVAHRLTGRWFPANAMYGQPCPAVDIETWPIAEMRCADDLMDHFACHLVVSLPGETSADEPGAKSHPFIFDHSHYSGDGALMLVYVKKPRP